MSFWPFKGDENSAASFEKTLSQVSTKITKASAQNDGLRQHQRRYKVLWTLYSSFAYILVALILTLVTGWDKWGAAEYSAVAGGPVLIYGVRTALDAYYNYRISNSQTYLIELYKQRETTIEKLKAATKYNSTQQLLDKYGGTPRKQQPSPQPPKKRKSEGGQSNQSTSQGARTGFAPPLTANIPGRQGPPPAPMTSEGTPGSAPGTKSGRPPQDPSVLQPQGEASEDFAPNAFSVQNAPPSIRQPSSNYATDGPKWYDRIMDVVLGEDETQAKNRLVLICQNCRLVNGQAPPGVRTLEELGRWRCSSCHAWNGAENEESKILQRMSGDAASPTSPSAPMSAATDPGPATVGLDDADDDDDDDDDDGDDDVDDSEEDLDDEEDEYTPDEALGDTPPASSTRSKARQRKKA